MIRLLYSCLNNGCRVVSDRRLQDKRQSRTSQGHCTISASLSCKSIGISHRRQRRRCRLPFRLQEQCISAVAGTCVGHCMCVWARFWRLTTLAERGAESRVEVFTRGKAWKRHTTMAPHIASRVPVPSPSQAGFLLRAVSGSHPGKISWCLSRRFPSCLGQKNALRCEGPPCLILSSQTSGNRTGWYIVNRSAVHRTPCTI